MQNGDSVGSTSVGVSVGTAGDVVSPNGVMMSVLVSPVLLVELELEELDDELDDSSHCFVPKGRTSDITNKYSRVDIVSSFCRLNPRKKRTRGVFLTQIWVGLALAPAHAHARASRCASARCY